MNIQPRARHPDDRKPSITSAAAASSYHQSRHPVLLLSPRRLTRRRPYIMRRGLLVFLILLFVLVGFLLNLVWTLLTLLFVDGSEDAISRSELPAPSSTLLPDRPMVVPKILHQTYKNASIPAVWQEAQQSCIDRHPADDGWEYKLWTDEKMAAFIADEYPWFRDTFENYPYPIQRADAIRYFVLSRYGGVYVDLDDGCNRSLDPLLAYPAWVRKTNPTGISNDAMGAVPAHPFFLRVIRELQRYDRSWLLPYITVMSTTGPLFLSIIWRRWSMEGFNTGEGRVRILFGEEYQGKPWSFFTHHLGNSWHAADVELIFWMARNWVLVTILGFTLGGAAIFVSWWTYHRFLLSSSSTAAPRSRSSSASSDSSFLPRWKRQSSARSRFPSLWPRSQSARSREYELVDRHEV